jgi:putative ABC transport system permease protein
MALVRQVVTESVVLAILGALAGLLGASWAMKAMVALLPSELPRAAGIGLELRAALFTFAVAVVAGVGLALLPAWQSARAAFSSSLQTSRHDGGEAGSPRLRGSLIAVEVALALVLLIGAAVTARSFVLLSRVSPGFDPRGVLTFWLSLPEAVYEEPQQVARFFDSLEARLRTLPGVGQAGGVMIPPVSRSGFGGTFTIDGRPEDLADEPRAQFRPATPSYFATIGLRVLRGRGIEERDREESLPVAVVSETTAKRYWPGEDPIGKRLRMHVSAVGAREPLREVVGVVQDVKTGGLAAPAAPVVYVPHRQHLSTFMTMMIRTAGNPNDYAGGAVAALRQVDKTVVAQDIRTLDAHVARARAGHRFRAALLGAFAGSAFLLSVLGLYAVVSYAVGRRRHEIGVRVALGAAPADIVRLVVAQGMLPVLSGMALGSLGALLLSSAVKTLLFGVRPFEPSMVALSAVLLGAAALLACYLPARRAASVAAVEALKAE